MIVLLRAADRVAMPWKNGGGITREVAIWPHGATLDNFDWRVSIAEVRDGGPFSAFEAIDRTMTILSGRIALHFPDRTIELDSQSNPFSFAGDVPCDGAPVGGPVTDLNVMTRRGRATARVERFGSTAATAAPHMVIVATALTNLAHDGSEHVLAAHDAALIANTSVTVAGEGYLTAFA